jgi:peptidyl-prolyl cis-trans isomerase A (cyclophilin A)
MKLSLILILVLLTISILHAQKVKISTSMGNMTVQLDSEKAPITSANFLKYVEENHYKGGSFFRTVRSDNQSDSPVKITVIQAGVHPWMQNFLFDPIPLERTNKTGIKHKNGTISMARDTPDSAQESFFICIGDQAELDFGGKRNPDGQGFAAFGHVIDGMEVVRQINESNAEGQAIMPPILILGMEVEE